MIIYNLFIIIYMCMWACVCVFTYIPSEEVSQNSSQIISIFGFWVVPISLQFNHMNL